MGVKELKDGVILRILAEKTELLFALLLDFDLVVKFEGSLLLVIAHLGSNLVLHPLVGGWVLQALVLLSEAQLLHGVDLGVNFVEFWRREHAVFLGVEGLESSAIEDIKGLTLCHLLLKQTQTVSPKEMLI